VAKIGRLLDSRVSSQRANIAPRQFGSPAQFDRTPEATMIAGFDVFRIDADERLYRLATAKSIEDAKKFVKILAIDSKREFCAIDQITGEKVVLKTKE
jgi:hypothetical protein